MQPTTTITFSELDFTASTFYMICSFIATATQTYHLQQSAFKFPLCFELDYFTFLFQR